MTLENSVRIVAGCMVLVSLALMKWVSPHFVWLTVFVGVNLIQSALTGFCPAEMLLRRCGVGQGKPGCGGAGKAGTA